MRSSRDGRSAVIKAPAVQRRDTWTGTRAPLPVRPDAPGSERLLVIAQQQAAAILAVARRDAEQLRQAAQATARTEGYSAGHVEGLAAGRMDAVREAQAEAGRIIEAAQAEAKRVLEGAEERLGVLACEIAAHLIGTELRQSPETIERAVAQTISTMGVEGDIAVEVAPDDYEQAVRALGAWRENIGTSAEIRIVVDPDLPRGGYRVLGPSGAVERNWEDGLKVIAHAFEEVARRGV